MTPAPSVLPSTALRRGSLDLIGVVPFMLYAALFLLIPTAFLVIGSFQDANGGFTLRNIANLFQPSILNAYWLTIQVSAASAIGGATAGLALALVVSRGMLPGWIKPTLLTFSGVASNFAGIPLAFAFIATLGRIGVVTMLLRNVFGINLYGGSFSLFSFWGLTLTYLYFQIPLMLLIIMPAVEGLKREWREAAETLGATSWQYWSRIGFPVLWPSVMGAALLLFANAFGAVATAYALTGSSLNLVTILLFAQIRGDVLHDTNLGYALAFGMIVITGISNAAYIVLRQRSERWLRR